MAMSDMDRGSYFFGRLSNPVKDWISADPAAPDPQGRVDTGFDRIGGIGPESGVVDTNFYAGSPYNPFFRQGEVDRPAYAAQTDPFRAQMRQAAKAGNASAYLAAQEAIAQADHIYSDVAGGLGLNDREATDAYRYGMSRAASTNLPGVSPRLAGMHAQYIAKQALNRKRHVRDLGAEEDFLDQAFSTAFGKAFAAAAGSGRVDANVQAALAAYRGNPGEREMRGLSAKQALQALEAETGTLYTKEVRADALRRYCDYFAASRAYSAFSQMDDRRLMREALDATLAQYDNRPDTSVFAKFNEACARFGGGFFSYTGNAALDEARGMQVRDRNGNAVTTGFVPFLRQVFEQQAAADLMRGGGTNYAELRDRLVDRLRARYGDAQGRASDEDAADVWKSIANAVVEQSRDGHVNCSRLAFLYAPPDAKPAEPPKVETLDGGVFKALSQASQDIVDRFVGQRPAVYGGWRGALDAVFGNSPLVFGSGRPFADHRDRERDMYTGKGMERRVSALVDDALSRLGDRALKGNEALVARFKGAMTDLVRGANTEGDPVFAGAEDTARYKRTAQATTVALALAANLGKVSGGGFGAAADYAFGRGSRGSGDDAESRLRGRTHSIENAFSQLRQDLEGYIAANRSRMGQGDERLETSLALAKSYLDGIGQIRRATADADKPSGWGAADAQVAMIRAFGGFDPLSAESAVPGSFSPYDIPAIADAVSARAAAAEAARGMVTDPADFGKQRMLNRFIQAAFSDKMNPVDSDRVASATEVLLNEACPGGFSGSPTMMAAARRELAPAVALAMKDMGHIVFQGDDPEGPGGVKVLDPTEDVWSDERTLTTLRRRVAKTLGRIRKEAGRFNEEEIRKLAAKRTLTANIQLEAQRAKEEGVRMIGNPYGNVPVDVPAPTW